MKTKLSIIWIVATLAIFACTLGQKPPPERPFPEPDTAPETPAQPETNSPSIPPSGSVIHPEDLTYLGAFRLPDASGGSNWEYSGHGLTHRPASEQD